MKNLVFKNIQVIDPSQETDPARGNFAVKDGKILGFIKDEEIPSDAKVIASDSYILTPGFRDVHVHFRDPGNPRAETRYSGADAAARGGFTCVTTMPNTTPAGDNVQWIREQIEDNALNVRIAPSACISKGRKGEEVAPLEELAEAGAAAFTDDGSFVDNISVMEEAMLRSAKLGKVVMQHAMVPSIVADGVIRDCAIARKYNLPIIPSEAELEAVRRDISLCRTTGCALHIQHISCAGTVELMREAQKEGLRVTGELTPHHICLSCEDILENDAKWKMAPPLGNNEDRLALLEAIKTGVISMFATDHAPHTAETKSVGFEKSANGIVGLETASCISWDVWQKHNLGSVREWVKRWTVEPAKLIGEKTIPLTKGNIADFAIFDLTAKKTVEPSTFKSRSTNQPFTGMNVPGWAVMTVMNGRITYNGLENI